jgi:site-specific recombinase XerD
MIDSFYSPGTDCSRLRCGSLGAQLDGFAGWLSEQGYAKHTGRQKIGLVAHFSRWLGRQQVGVKDLNEEQVAEFLKVRKKRGLLRRDDQPTLAQLLGYLHEADIIARPASAVSDTPMDHIIQGYAQFLTYQRGLNPVTIDNYLPIARSFLEARFGAERICLDKLRIPDVTGFMVRDGATFSPRRAQLTACVLRSFLGFLTHEGKITTNLAAAVPAVANWRLSELPQFLEPTQVDQILGHCNQNSAIGRRDYAVLLLVARLGLRAGEVVHLNLESINWETGEVYIRGKSAREDRLPLLPEVGRAVAAYLKRDRPSCPCRRVFLRMKAPRQGFSSSVAIDNIVRRALVRAQLQPPHKGAHLLRRSLATQMLRQGATLTPIGQILRHQRAQTTEIYAKVDLAALRALAQPWPGGAH